MDGRRLKTSKPRYMAMVSSSLNKCHLMTIGAITVRRWSLNIGPRSMAMSRLMLYANLGQTTWGIQRPILHYLQTGVWGFLDRLLFQVVFPARASMHGTVPKRELSRQGTRDLFAFD